jgi:hypothetical protein
MMKPWVTNNYFAAAGYDEDRREYDLVWPSAISLHDQRKGVKYNSCSLLGKLHTRKALPIVYPGVGNMKLNKAWLFHVHKLVLRSLWACFLVGGVLAGAVATEAQTPEMDPLSEYLGEASRAGSLDMVDIRYFSLRCLGVLGMTSEAISNNTQGSAAELRQRVGDATKFHMTAFQRAHKKIQPEDIQFVFFQANFKLILDMYGDRALKSRAATGKIFADTLLRDDLNLCLETAEEATTQ